MGKVPYTEAKRKNNKKWDDANLKTCTVRMKVELYEKFEQYCNQNGMSKNGMINQAIIEKLQRAGFLDDQQ